MTLPNLTQEQLLSEAVAIAGQIRAHVRHSRTGSVAWVGPTGYNTELSPLLTKPLAPGLAIGSTGVALFLAAVARLEGDRDLRQLALDALAPLRRRLRALLDDPEAGREPLRLGGTMGLGSYLYGLVTIGDLLGEPALLDEAHEATVLITPEQIERDGQPRVQTGCAGAILALLALHARRPEANRAGKSLLELASECGRHLLANRLSFDGRPRAWALSPGKPPLIGFGYGAAGICHALQRLYRETGDPELLEAAAEGLAFVRTFYLPEQGRWHDPRAAFESRYRPRSGTWADWWQLGSLEDLEPIELESDRVATARPQFQRTWCHGSAGILLGKVAGLDLEDTAETRAEIEGGLEDLCRAAASEVAPGELDDPCCGRAGQAEALLFASLKLGESRYLDAARREATKAWHQARLRGRYTLQAARGTDRFAPTFFQGMAGVGYTFLRLAMPRELPSVLLLEG
jgi:lantibiotic modifying enzyme